jgi:hypothetical protein
MPCELPTVAQWKHVFQCGGSTDVDSQWEALTAVDFVRSHLSLILAAKDTRAHEEMIARQNAQRDEAALREQLTEANARIAELESCMPANEVRHSERAQYETTITQQNAKIEELRAVLDKVQTERNDVQARNTEYRDFHIALHDVLHVTHLGLSLRVDLDNVLTEARHSVKERDDAITEAQRLETQLQDAIDVTANHWREKVAEMEKRLVDTEASRKAADAMVDARQKRIQELEKCLVEATAVPTVDGKTPGQFLVDAYNCVSNRGLAGAESNEQVANAVLRAFGGEALRMVRERIDATERMSNDTEYGKEWIHRGETLAIIDDEIESLGAPAVSQFIANENEIRGAFFWEGTTNFMSPGLVVDPAPRTMDFNYVPQQLKLERGDIIEIRVVERAKR